MVNNKRILEKKRENNKGNKNDINNAKVDYNRKRKKVKIDIKTSKFKIFILINF